MSEENIHKQKFLVEQWPTSKVTLYPTRASVVRQIDGVKLKNGLNEITISNLTSAADPDSIRVSGTTDRDDQPARISDLTVNLIANATPTNDDDESDEEDEVEEDDEEPASLKAVSDEIDKLRIKIKSVTERRSSAQKELSFIEQYAFSSTTAKDSGLPSPDTMKATLELYNSQRVLHFQTITITTDELDELELEVGKKRKVLTKEKALLAKATKGKLAEKRKKELERAERRAEKLEKWPERSLGVYRVRITIEIPSSDPPSSSENECEAYQEATLHLTYTTASATWTPHYDLRLDTTNPSASTLTYRAQFTNRTFETWSNAAITLSTSQASFGGLNEKIPTMDSWRVTLGRKYNTSEGENGLYSLAEVQAKRAAEIAEYGLDIVALRDQEKSMKTRETARRSATKSKKAAFGSIMRPISAPPPPAIIGGAAGYSARFSEKQEEAEESNDDMGFSLFDEADGGTFSLGPKPIQHSLAGADTYGFTTTYELPTVRTIPSSPLIRRHVIAELPLPSLLFTHIVIPKLKAAAFLKAKVTNTSAVPLLPGQAGLTLDGGFMGYLAFPRCAPSEQIVLELGVDQSVKVEYERPTVKHGTQGIMMLGGKEEVGAYKRVMRITNSKSSTVSLVVLDQIPVPEDERLKVNITLPKGLKEVDDVVKNGVGVDGKVQVQGKTGQRQNVAVAPAPVPAKPTAKLDAPETASVRSKTFSFGKKDSISKGNHVEAPPPPAPAPAPVSTSAPTPGKASGTSWGTAKACLKKNGEVRWDVDLHKGNCVALGLEWECRMPSGDGVEALS